MKGDQQPWFMKIMNIMKNEDEVYTQQRKCWMTWERLPKYLFMVIKLYLFIYCDNIGY